MILFIYYIIVINFIKMIIYNIFILHHDVLFVTLYKNNIIILCHIKIFFILLKKIL